MISTISLTVDSTLSVVQQLDEQILASVEGEFLSADQQNELLQWVHSHLLSPYVAVELDACLDSINKPGSKHPVQPCLSAVETIRQMLEGGVPLGPDLTFECPPSSCADALALSQRMPTSVRSWTARAAQRTRLHAESELQALWNAVEAHLITSAITRFEMADFLYANMPPAEELDAVTFGYLEAMLGVRGLVWTPAGAVLQV